MNKQLRQPRQQTMKVKELTDLGLIAGLMTLGHQPKARRLEGKRVIFVFETDPNFENLCSSYFSKGMKGNFYDYNATLRAVKSSIFQIQNS